MIERAAYRPRKFIHYYEHAAQRLLASGITSDQIEELREYGLMARDNVTGYFEGRSGPGRVWTVRSAIRHAVETGEKAHYVEMDLRNLGGLNAAVGHTKANEVFAAIADVVRRELSAISSESAFYRHGGDEVCAILATSTTKAIRNAFKRIDRRTANLAEEYGVADIPHPKHRGDHDQRGIGVVFGLVRLSARFQADPTDVFRQADLEMRQSLRRRTRRNSRSFPSFEMSGSLTRRLDRRMVVA